MDDGFRMWNCESIFVVERLYVIPWRTIFHKLGTQHYPPHSFEANSV